MSAPEAPRRATVHDSQATPRNCEDYCERDVDADQEAALRRLRAAFGFVEVLPIVDHEAGQDQGEGELDEDGEPAPPADR